MAYVPNFEHDVFVSYAHLDNEEAGRSSQLGWVDDFIAELTVQLRRRLGSSAVDVWIDRELARNKPLTPELRERVQGSALLLVVMSPSYLNSRWCEHERNDFLGLARERLEQGRVFIVNLLDVEPAQRPPEFKDIVGYKFWVHDREVGVTRTLGEIDRHEPEFLRQIYALSAHMAKNALAPLAAAHYASTRASQPTARNDGGRVGVFIARSTDDLEDREQELRNYLVQAGLRVCPRRIYAQATRESFEDAVSADLKGCRLFVQLLGASKGPEVAFEETNRLPSLLYDVAQRSGIEVLQWRDRGLDLKTIAAITDSRHRAIVEGAIACPIEEFKRMVVDLATRPVESPAKRPPKVIVFVDRMKDDRGLAEQVAATLTKVGAQVYFPMDEGTPEEIRKDLESALRDADGVLMVFGASELATVRTRLREHTKVLNQRQTAPAALAVFEGPPGDRGKLEQLRASISDPDILIIDGAEGVSQQQLAPFIARLRSSGSRSV